ncbi:MAG TPA: DUF1998 domain-containing protein [Longimicrobium sp.]|nr:DUF1998 domain-containing protein [Longimicrobium sp.]
MMVEKARSDATGEHSRDNLSELHREWMQARAERRTSERDGLMPPRAPNISPLQVIYQAFPDAMRFVSGQITRVRDVVSARGEREDRLSDLVRRSLARRIYTELARRHAHDLARYERRAARQALAGAAEGGGGATAAGNAGDSFDPFDLILPGDASDGALADGMGAAAAGAARPPSPPAMPQEREISLIEVDDDATVRTRVFPRTVHCRRCGHFELLDPEHVPATLHCPCCREGMFRIEPIVFICGRCADVRELVPPTELRGNFRRPGVPGRVLGAPIHCPDCHRGHVHLEIHETNDVERWEWRCTACTSYRVTLQERCLRCVLPGADAESASVIFMKPVVASAPNALQALAYQEMFVGNQAVDLPGLRAAAAAARAAGWADAFDLDVGAPGTLVSGEDAAALADASLGRAYLVRDVWAVTACYGYKAGPSASHPQSHVDPDERLATFFRDPEGFARFRAFMHTTRGAALVLELDAEQVVERLAERNPGLAGQTLADLIRAEAAEIAHTEVRDLLQVGEGALPAYRALHAVEHALLMAAMRQLGTDTLGSRLFPAEAAIVLFEKSAVGRGGVVQLVNRGGGLVQLLHAAQDFMAGCIQGCVDGCPSCVYVRDQHCGHPLDELGAGWLPANALLSRAGAAAILLPEGMR